MLHYITWKEHKHYDRIKTEKTLRFLQNWASSKIQKLPRCEWIEEKKFPLYCLHLIVWSGMISISVDAYILSHNLVFLQTVFFFPFLLLLVERFFLSIDNFFLLLSYFFFFCHCSWYHFMYRETLIEWRNNFKFDSTRRHEMLIKTK